MGIFDSLIDKLKYTATVPTYLAGKLANNVGGDQRGVVSAPPPLVSGNPQGGLESDRSPFGMLPNVSGIGQDPMQNYLNQLLRGINAGRPPELSIQELRRQAAKQAGLQFDPEINSLIGERSATKSRAGRNKREISSMYSDLAKDYIGDVKTSKKQTKEAKASEKAAYNQLKKDLAGGYSKQLDAQTEELTNLGVEAALPEATKGQKEDLDFLSSLNATESAAQQRAIDLSGLADASYFQKGSGIAKMEGNETVSDLMMQLEDYLRQTGGQLSSLKGQKASAIQQLISQMQGNQSDDQMQFENNRWQRLMSIAQLQRALTNDAASKTNQMAQTPSKGIEGALGLLQQQLGGNSQRSSDALMNLLQSQEMREGRFETPNKQIVDMTPENAAYLARQYAAKNKLTPQETDALVKSVFAYYGKLR